MDSHNKRLNYINRFNLGHVGLTPNGTVEEQDVKNYIWLPFFFNYPAPEEHAGLAAAVLDSKLLVRVSSYLI